MTNVKAAVTRSAPSAIAKTGPTFVLATAQATDIATAEDAMIAASIPTVVLGSGIMLVMAIPIGANVTAANCVPVGRFV